MAERGQSISTHCTKHGIKQQQTIKQLAIEWFKDIFNPSLRLSLTIKDSLHELIGRVIQWMVIITIHIWIDRTGDYIYGIVEWTVVW